jgi:hypothetical protein
MLTIRTFVVVAIALLVVQVFSPQAAAQGRGMRGFGPSLTRLLLIPEVQTELKLDSDLIEKVKAFAEESQTKLREEFELVREQGLGEAEMRAEMADVMEEFRVKDTAEVAKLLSPEQFDRLKQLMLQQQGASAVVQKDVAEAIGLAEDERAKLKQTIDELNDASRQQMQDLFQSGDREQIEKVMAENRQKIDEAVLAVLSDEQEEKFIELKGAEFKFPEPQRRGGRRDF